MIYDCFTFFNELDLLELRLRVLEDAVDRFVLCESPFTFRGTPKELVFREHAGRFARWSDRIVHLVYPGPPDPDPWRNEWNQRNYLATAVAGCEPSDWMLLGDVDEIPDPANVARRPRSAPMIGHGQRHSVGYANRVADFVWVGTRSFAPSAIARFGTLSQARLAPASDYELVEGGWHFSSFGGAEVLQQKLRAYSHSETDLPYFTDLRRLQLEHEGAHETHWIPLDDSFPAALRNDPRFAEYVWSAPPVRDQAELEVLEHVHGLLAYVAPAAPAVAVLSADAAPWPAAVRERFGPRFAGVGTRLEHLPPLPPESWIVVDRLERLPPDCLAAARGRGLRLVAFARNARSYRRFEDAIAGKPFPPGRAIGYAEAAGQLRAAGFEQVRTERIKISGVFSPWLEFPETMADVAFSESSLGFRSISRAELIDFLADAFLFIGA